MPQPLAATGQATPRATRILAQLKTQLTAEFDVIESQIDQLNTELDDARSERQAETAEKERIARRHQALIQALPAGVVVIDGRGRVLESNAAAVSLLGEPLTGEAWSDVIARAFDVVNTGSDALTLRNGRMVTLSTCPMGSEPGQILLLQDVTEQQQLNRQLEQQRRLADMGRMAASLAHQIRTPLSSALLYASQLQTSQLSFEQQSQFAERTVNSLRNLERLINNMLVFVRGNKGRQETLQPVSLVEEALNSLQQQLADSGVAVSISGCTTERQITGNRPLLVSALQNLINNAMQAVGKGGLVELHVVDAPNQSIDLVVQDNGPGIPQALQSKIFEPFETTRARGTGLGLAVVRAVARSHHGEAWVESQPGAGSRFIVRLPASEGGE